MEYHCIHFTGLAMATEGGDVVVTEKAATVSCSAAAVPAATIAWTVTDKEGNMEAQIGKK